MEFIWMVCDMNRSVQSENNVAESILSISKVKFSNTGLPDPI